MKSLLCLCALVLFIIPGRLAADDQLRSVQEELKNQGFFYGEVTGQSGAETTAAIRRYQIRNGLQVTGALNKETLSSLRLGGGGAPADNTTDAEEAPSTANRSDGRTPDRALVESDKSFLRREETHEVAPPASAGRRQAPLEERVAPTGPPVAVAPSAGLISLFARTPYERAPADVQRETLKRAQLILAREGFYHGDVDGVPGVDTQRALLRYQDDLAIRRSGRLDMETLDELQLLPGDRASPFSRRRSAEQQPSRRVFRGVWVR